MMVLSRGNRLYLRRLLRSRVPKIALAVILLVNLLDVLRVYSRVAHADRTPSPPPPSAQPKQHRERIYITAMHWNDGGLLRAHWLNALLNLTDVLGPENVFVSVYESGSWDDTKVLLNWLDEVLEYRGVPHRVEMSDWSHNDEVADGDPGEGWITTPQGERLPRRIPFLARLRNQTLRDLLELHEKGVSFDKVLFLNDVVFSTDDVLTLLNTNNGEYAAACSLDFAKPPLYYDTFALRDSHGQPHASHVWPYFKSSLSRNALVNHVDAVPVTSCWNGIVAMPAEPFVSSSKLRFRGVVDSLAEHHVEGSECCLIHADNPLSKTLGVYVNPRVRVGYNVTAYERTHPERRSWVSLWDIFYGMWVNRLNRWFFSSWREYSSIQRRLRQWEREGPGRREPGDFCLIDEMHVIVWNGWAHV